MITPLQDYVLLEEIKMDLSKSGIIIPDDSFLEKTNKAIVLGMGERVSLPVKNGSTVLIKPYGFDVMKIEDKEYLFGRQENVIAVIS